jgi:hypothetical protein
MVLQEIMVDWPEKDKEKHIWNLVDSWGIPMALGDGLKYEKYISKMKTLRSARSRSRVINGKNSEATQRLRKSAAKRTRR